MRTGDAPARSVHVKSSPRLADEMCSRPPFWMNRPATAPFPLRYAEELLRSFRSASERASQGDGRPRIIAQRFHVLAPEFGVGLQHVTLASRREFGDQGFGREPRTFDDPLTGNHSRIEHQAVDPALDVRNVGGSFDDRLLQGLDGHGDALSVQKFGARSSSIVVPRITP